MFALPYAMMKMGVLSGILSALFFGIIAGLAQKICVGSF